jgi:hypothetical protein
MPTPETLRLVAEARRALAGDSLTSRQAKLYSQRIRLEMGRQGLATFLATDVSGYIDEAVWLIECSLIERTAVESDWRNGLKRAAEILELLSQRDLRPAGTPLRLLSAAAYQVAGFPAMALAQLTRVPVDEPFSRVLHEFLRGNFRDALEAVRQFWSRDAAVGMQPEPNNLEALAVRHVVMCIGVVCMHFRTGDETRTDRAVSKLHALARIYLHSRDAYSYLLARLTALSAAEFVSSSLWNGVRPLSQIGSDDTRSALQQFARAAFINRRALIWPAQAKGISRLSDSESFVLCTPTGSGKTTVATLAVVQGLVTQPPRPRGLENLEADNLILYVVPSRALAAEVEQRLAEDLRGIAATPVVVTGLYGGTDWGPTDAWIQNDGPTIVICTFEKADALLRYLGVLFLHRVRLVVIDEAHMVEVSGDRAEPPGGTSRSLRLELLGTRLLDARDRYSFRIIALSAVAAAAGPALARWVGGSPDAVPTSSTHRSTRQMLGRIDVGTRGGFNIRYDLMNGRSLRFEDQQGHDTPFVPAPFPAMPGAISFDEPEKAMQAPTLWAALHLAAERPDGSRPSVLISVTQNVGAFALECATRLDEWPSDQLPTYRDSTGEADSLWRRSVAAAADYFGEASAEYRLLQRGIVVHHGKMPGLLARRLKVLMDRGYVRVIIATSTLSEGVNIPVTYLLIPSVYRSAAPFSLQEFTNLIGRAGRPGVSSEGHVLVVLPEPGAMPFVRGRRKVSRQRKGYEDLVASLTSVTAAAVGRESADSASSPLSLLLSAIADAWRTISPNATPEDLQDWLEQTSVTELSDVEPGSAIDYLDSLDAFIIAALHELEELSGEQVPDAELEAAMSRIWRRSYAHAAAVDEARLGRIFLARGSAIKQRYPDAQRRRQIYRTSLSPRSAVQLLDGVDAIRNRLTEGVDYAAWSVERRLAYVGDVLEMIASVASFRIGNSLGRRKNFTDWRGVLRWWLAKSTLVRQPDPARVADWYQFAASSFIYRGAWGIGSVLSLLLDTGEDGQLIAALELDDWPRSGLPWIAFWMKELLTWGTVDPVAAFLLARGNAIDRPAAEREAEGYYEQLPTGIDNNERLNPRRIREWVDQRGGVQARTRAGADLEIEVTLTRSPDEFVDSLLNVMHVENGQDVMWLDAAGYLVARSAKPRDWPSDPWQYRHQLNVQDARVTASLYLPHV